VVPATGEEDVVAVGRRIKEHIIGGVGRPGEGPHDRRKGGLPLEHEEFRWLLAYVDRGYPVRERGLRLNVTTVNQVHLAALGQRLGHLVYARRQPHGLIPGLLKAPGEEPPVIHMEVVRVAPLRPENQRMGVDDPFELAIGNRPQDGRAIYKDEERRRITHKDRGRRVVHRDADRLRGIGGDQRSLQAVERDDSLGDGGHLRLEAAHIRNPVVGDSGKVTLVQGKILENHHPGDPVHLRSCPSPDHAEGLLIRADRLDPDRGSKVEHVPVPGIDLRLVHEQRGIGKLELARPHVGNRRGPAGALGRCNAYPHQPEEEGVHDASFDSLPDHGHAPSYHHPIKRTRRHEPFIRRECL
jgi:hypothetical protein